MQFYALKFLAGKGKTLKQTKGKAAAEMSSSNQTFNSFVFDPLKIVQQLIIVCLGSTYFSNFKTKQKITKICWQ